MAGHLPVKNTMFRLALLAKAMEELKQISNLEYFQRVEIKQFPKYKTMILPIDEYQMNDEHGLVDDKVIAVCRMEDTLEYHLDKNGKINEIYLVM